MGLKETRSQSQKKPLPHAFLYSLFPRWQSYGITTTRLVSYKEGHGAILITVFQEQGDIGNSPFSEPMPMLKGVLLLHKVIMTKEYSKNFCSTQGTLSTMYKYSVHENHRVGVKVPAGVESNYV